MGKEKQRGTCQTRSQKGIETGFPTNDPERGVHVSVVLNTKRRSRRSGFWDGRCGDCPLQPSSVHAPTRVPATPPPPGRPSVHAAIHVLTDSSTCHSLPCPSVRLRSHPGVVHPFSHRLLRQHLPSCLGVTRSSVAGPRHAVVRTTAPADPARTVVPRLSPALAMLTLTLGEESANSGASVSHRHSLKTQDTTPQMKTRPRAQLWEEALVTQNTPPRHQWGRRPHAHVGSSGGGSGSQRGVRGYFARPGRPQVWAAAHTPSGRTGTRRRPRSSPARCTR